MPKTIKQEFVEDEIVEKKSKFIASIFYVNSEEEAETKIKEIKKKYYDSRHNCFAYRILQENRILERASDDGEPSGTAGFPILNIISKQELVNILVIVTRYFGGILLGTGGLVKAYSEATQKALEQAEFIEETHGVEIEIETQYSETEKIKYYCKKENIRVLDIQYGQKVKMILEMTNETKLNFIKKIEESEKINFKIENYKIIKEKIVRI